MISLNKIKNHLRLGKKRISPPKRIVMGFILIIAAGTALLMLPFASKDGNGADFMTAVFTASSAVCVTGLTVVETGQFYSFFGQAVIIILIQIGGLGFMTILTVAFFASNRYLGLRDRIMLAQTFGLSEIEGVVKITRHVLAASFIAESMGALLLGIRFVPEYGIRGIWYSVFHSISAFCNAGFDVFGNGNSLVKYAHDPLVLLTLSALIITGGMGFIVWEELINYRKKQRFAMYTRLVMVMTLLLLLIGTIGFFVLEYNNRETMAGDSMLNKLLSSFFQSVTCRTAGFDALGQSALTEQSKLLAVVLMMIGGASGSTAGGIKVVTVAIVFIAAYGVLSEKNKLVIKGRQIGTKNIIYSMTLFVLWFVIIMSASLILGVLNNSVIIDCIYEAASAYGTAGLSVGVTANASTVSRWILIALMFFGRVGIMSIGVTLMTRREKKSDVEYPQAKILLG